MQYGTALASWLYPEESATWPNEQGWNDEQQAEYDENIGQETKVKKNTIGQQKKCTM